MGSKEKLMTSIQKFALVPVVAFSLFLSPVVRAEDTAAPAKQEAPAAEQKKDDCDGGCDKDCSGKNCKMKKKAKTKKGCKNCETKHGKSEEHKEEKKEEAHH
jgi:hypothetical protein